MKKLFYSIIILLLSTTVFAQAPQSFKYQAVVRDVSGEIIADQQVSFQISILQNSASGTAVYTETHFDSTNQFGLVTLEIGTGTTTDDFIGIDWSNDAYFIQIEMDATGGTSYTLMGTSQILSVPYALHAKSAENTFSGDYNDLINKPEIPDTLSDLVTDAGNKTITNLADPVNNQDAVTKGYVDLLEDRIFDLEYAAGNDTITDYDDNEYGISKIGNQYWMAENLKTTHYANGDIIPDGTTAAGDISGETEPKYWFAYNYDSNNVSTYGRLYTWYTVTDSRNVCPDGWHVPSNAEWTILVTYLGGSSVAGGKMKETGTTHWNSPNTGATNESSFTALPGGDRYYAGTFDHIGSWGTWWSATEGNTTNAFFLRLFYNEAGIIWNTHDNKMYGFSVRCVKY
ncbi:hypothetical protein ES705_26395 [subsurface metagenome]